MNLATKGIIGNGGLSLATRGILSVTGFIQVIIQDVIQIALEAKRILSFRVEF